MVSSTAAGSECGGMTQAESPEWMPASSMCSMIPPTTTVSPSARQSTSTSIASSRNLSIRIGCSPEAAKASPANSSSEASS